MSDSTIICPNCKTEFPLTESLAAPLLASPRAALPVATALRHSLLQLSMELTWIGKDLRPKLELQLTRDNGCSYSVDNLEAFRQFYLEYPQMISETVSRKSVAAGGIGSPRCDA